MPLFPDCIIYVCHSLFGLDDIKYSRGPVFMSIYFNGSAGLFSRFVRDEPHRARYSLMWWTEVT